VLDEDSQIYGHWIAVEGQADRGAAVTGGISPGTNEVKIVPFSVPNLQLSANKNAIVSVTD
jgi:hypothetical protein